MKSSIEIVHEIEAEAAELQEQIAVFGKKAADLQKSMLSLPGSKGANVIQSRAIDEAQDGLRFWRRTHLERLKEVFGDDAAPASGAAKGENNGKGIGNNTGEE